MNQAHDPQPQPTAEAPLGQADRYELLGRLEEGFEGVLYAARDTVTGDGVSLLLLPAPLVAAPGALDGLRASLAPIARFRHPGVAHLLHLAQLWELDAAARAETGAEPGVAALVSELPGGPTLADWRRRFPAGRPPCEQTLDLLWEMAEALDALHGAGLVHGALSAESIRLAARGPVLVGAAVGGHVRQAMARLGLAPARPESRPADALDDLLALGQIARALLPPAADLAARDVLEPLAEPGAYASARQFAGALREAVGDGDEEQPPPAEPAEEEPLAVRPPAPAPPPSSRHSAPVLFEAPASRSPRAGRWINIALAVAALVALALAAAVALSRRPPPAEPQETLSWTPLQQDKQPSPTFVWQATLPALAPGQHLRFRTYGQTRVLAVVLTPQRLTIQETTGQGDTRELAATDCADWTAGDVLAVAKGPDSLAAYRNGVRLAIAPCPLERWRLVRWDQAGGLVPASLSAQKVGPLVFADDFMHGENELGPWQAESGTWATHAVDCPIRSANPFSFAGKGDNAVASTGYWFWRNYRFACSAHPLAGSAFGISFCRRDAENSYDLRWRGDEGGGTLELSRLAGGQRQSLARQRLPLRPYSWIQFAARQLDGLLVVEVDGHEQFRVTDPAPLLGGGIALWTDGGEGTVFDDVTVGAVDALEVTAATAPSLAASLLPAGDGGEGTCTLGGVLLENATVALEAPLAGRADPVELFARRNGPKAVRCRIVPGPTWRAEIAATSPEGEAILAAGEFAPPGARSAFALSVLGREAWASVDGRIVAYAPYVPVLGRGQCGVRTAGAPFAPTALAVRPALPLPNIDNRVQTFTHEQSMQNWNSPVLAWTPDYTSSIPLYWHRSDFWADVAASADVAELAALDGVQTWGVALAEEDAEDGGAARRWELFVVPDDPDIHLRAPGAEPRRLAAKGSLRSLALERRGDLLIARQNGRALWHGNLPAGGGGLLRVGRIGRGATDEWAQAVEIRAAGVRTYSFKEAPADWLPASGEWKVTNRWQCDPRWSFFSGVQRGGPACLWNKREHGDNITLEFFVGPKMDQERGKRYEYAADFNAVICADGQDISSGYSFLYGGWDDRGSQIVRGDKILVENERIAIPRKSAIHRRWFHVKLRKRGSQLAFWVDGALVGSVRDERPLDGRRFGLWTWDNGFMVAQVRVATDGPMRSVAADRPPNPSPRTPYSK